MTVPELARLCAVQLVQRLADGSRLTDEERIALVESYVGGALNRALSESGQPEARAVHVGGPGAIDVKITKSTQGVALEVDVKRPREARESWSDATDASALLAAVAYTRASDQLAKIGLTPGREAKA